MKLNNGKEVIRFSDYPWLKEDKDFLYKLTFVEKFRTYNPMHLKITKLFK